MQGCRLLSGQHQISCLFADSTEIGWHEKHPGLANGKGVVNNRSHVSLQTRQKLVWHGWDVLIHSRYLPDLLTFGLPLISKLCQILLNRRTPLHWKPVKTLKQVHLQEIVQILGEWNHEATSKMVKGNGTKKSVYKQVVFEIRLKMIQIQHLIFHRIGSTLFFFF